MKDEWASTWYNLICESEQLIEAIGEGGSECFAPSQLKEMNNKSIRLSKQAEAIAKAWRQNRTDNLYELAVKRYREIIN